MKKRYYKFKTLQNISDLTICLNDISFIQLKHSTASTNNKLVIVFENGKDITISSTDTGLIRLEELYTKISSMLNVVNEKQETN